MTLGVQQTYYSNRESSKYDTTYASSSNNRNPIDLSPVALNIRVSPSAKIDANSRLEYDVSGLGLAVWTVGSTVSAGQSYGTLSYSRRHFTRDSKPDTYLSGFDVAEIAERSCHRHLRAELGHHAFDGRFSEHPRDLHGAVLRPAGRISEIQLPRSSGFPIPSDRRINFSFVLAGLGTFSNFFGAFGGPAVTP